MALQCRIIETSNSLVFHTSWSISSSPVAFHFLIFLSTESSSSYVNCPSLMSSWLLKKNLIGSLLTFGGFPKKILEMLFPRVYSFFLAGSFQFSTRSTLPPSAYFVYCLPYNPRLSILNRVFHFNDLIFVRILFIFFFVLFFVFLGFFVFFGGGCIR